MRGERWLVTGSTGLVGTIVSTAAARAGVHVVRASLSGRAGSLACDLRDARATARLLAHASPDRVIHLAAVSSPALAAEQADVAYDLNVRATELIADWCLRQQRGLIFSSTDQVFDGDRGPYRECDRPAPVTVYGQTKLAAERLVLAAGGLVARLGWVLNDRPAPRSDFVERGLVRLRRGEVLSAADDEHRTPVYGDELGRAVMRLAELDHRGALHVAGAIHTTPYEVLRARALQAGLDATAIRRISRRELAPPGRPRDVRLDTTVLLGLLARTPQVAHA
ncbi:SDR family oxidoreductase [Phenylobacterium sp.]|uniref:SDR family oxidoreductase n=1 Tax=Phenylobacterium sp. TaxID=1871053 RepID=UPI002EDB886E